MPKAAEYAVTQRNRYEEELFEFLRIPSVSTLPEHKPDIERAASYAREQLIQAGLESAEVIEGEGHPLVYGEWLGAPGKPTVLLYGHYDVQPVDPIDEWRSPPFEPTVRDGQVYARGGPRTTRDRYWRTSRPWRPCTRRAVGCRSMSSSWSKARKRSAGMSLPIS